MRAFAVQGAIANRSVQLVTKEVSMSVRRFVYLVSTVAICLQLAVGGPQLETLSRAAEPTEKPASRRRRRASRRTRRRSAAKDAAAKDAQKQNEDDFELLELFADTLDQVERNYVKDVTRRQLMEAAIRGMLSELDPYSNFIPPKQLDRFKVEVENEFGGVGIQVSFDNGQLRVISPLVGTPAYRAGVMSGDLIAEIDGESTKGITLDEAVQRMKGLVGTKVKLKVLHAGAMEPETIELERENIRVETVLGDARNPDDSWRWLVDQEKGIGYIRVTGFGRHTAEDLQKAMQQLADQKRPRLDPGPAFQSGRAAVVGDRGQRPVRCQGPDRQHGRPQRGTAHLGRRGERHL